MTTKDFIYKALKQETRKDTCSSVFSKIGHDGNVTVYSYGYHYPLAKIVNGIGFVNNTGYSNTTAKHINWATSAVADIVGYENTYLVPTGSFTKDGLMEDLSKEIDQTEQVMATKKRKDTKVFEMLQDKVNRLSEARLAVRRLA